MKYLLMTAALLIASVSMGSEDQSEPYVAILDGFEVHYGSDETLHVPIGNMKVKDGVIFSRGEVTCNWKLETDFPGRDGIYVDIYANCSIKGSDLIFSQLLVNCKYVTELRSSCDSFSTINIEGKNRTEHRIHAFPVYRRLK